MPKISVIVPSYNYAHFLPRCLDSLLNQTLSDIEVIVVDDCSTDNTSEVIKAYLTDSRVQYIRNEKNLKSHLSRIVGTKAALRNKPEYIAFCDADDFYEKDAMDIMYHTAKKYEADILHASSVFGPSSHTLGWDTAPYLWEGTSVLGDFLNSHGSWTLCGSIYSERICQKYIEEAPQISLTNAEDLLANIIFYYHAQKAVGIPQGVYNYMINDTSAVQNPSLDSTLGSLRDHSACIREIQKFSSEKKINLLYQEQLSYCYDLLIWYSFARLHDNFSKEFGEIWEEHAPQFFKSRILYILMKKLITERSALAAVQSSPIAQPSLGIKSLFFLLIKAVGRKFLKIFRR